MEEVCRRKEWTVYWRKIILGLTSGFSLGILKNNVRAVRKNKYLTAFFVLGIRPFQVLFDTHHV